MSQLFQDDGPPKRPGSTGQKVCLATTAYDSPDASHTFSIQRSRAALAEAGIQSAYYLLSGNCHVDDARNSIVAEFLDSDCTDLVFLDADVSWEPEQLVRLCRHDKDVVGGVYPYRREDMRAAGNLPVRMLDGAKVAGGLLEVEGLPTGFLRIRREVLSEVGKYADHFIKDGRTVKILFERTLIDGTRWGGDLNFCRKWRAIGGHVFADYELRLGHAAKTVLHDSLGSALRRRAGVTLRNVSERIRENKDSISDLIEARAYVSNPFGALEDVLALSVALARKADGPIIETGSGLTTVLMAAATDQTVYCLEHHGLYAAQLRQMAAEAGVTNIGLCVCPVKGGWYDLSGMDLPDHFALGLNDGPPRTVGSRMGFFEHLTADTIICDDADDPGYAESLETWATIHGRGIRFIEPRAALITRQSRVVLSYSPHPRAGGEV